MIAIEKLFKKEIRELERVKDTLDERFEYLRLDKNERLLAFDEKLFDEFKANVKSEDLSSYAELGFVYRVLAEYLNVSTEAMLLASGSDLAIKSIYESCVERGDNVVLHAPSYAMYRVYAKMFGAEPRMVPVGSDWNLDVQGMLSRVDNSTKMLVIENPNGFVGSKPSLEEIRECAAFLAKKGAILLIDEAYLYVENDRSETIPLIAEYPGLIVSQSLSKGHGLAGARAGYIVGDTEVMRYISRVRPMHEVTNLTGLAIEWVIRHPEILAEYQQMIRRSKDYLKAEISLLGIPYKDTHANFVLFYFPEEGKTKGITQRLKDNMILIRRPFEESNLKGWCRVCVGTLDDCRRFMDTLKQLLH